MKRIYWRTRDLIANVLLWHYGYEHGRHWSDCALHNYPAYMPRRCNCGGLCTNACAVIEPYGWVPEAGCLTHDPKEVAA